MTAVSDDTALVRVGETVAGFAIVAVPAKVYEAWHEALRAYPTPGEEVGTYHLTGNVIVDRPTPGWESLDGIPLRVPSGIYIVPKRQLVLEFVEEDDDPEDDTEE